MTVEVARLRLCHSRTLFARTGPRETQEMVFDAHGRASGFFEGARTRGIRGNTKAAVESIFAAASVLATGASCRCAAAT